MTFILYGSGLVASTRDCTGDILRCLVKRFDGDLKIFLAWDRPVAQISLDAGTAEKSSSGPASMHGSRSTLRDGETRLLLSGPSLRIDWADAISCSLPSTLQEFLQSSNYVLLQQPVHERYICPCSASSRDQDHRGKWQASFSALFETAAWPASKRTPSSLKRFATWMHGSQ